MRRRGTGWRAPSPGAGPSGRPTRPPRARTATRGGAGRPRARRPGAGRSSGARRAGDRPRASPRRPGSRSWWRSTGACTRGRDGRAPRPPCQERAAVPEAWGRATRLGFPACRASGFVHWSCEAEVVGGSRNRDRQVRSPGLRVRRHRDRPQPAHTRSRGRRHHVGGRRVQVRAADDGRGDGRRRLAARPRSRSVASAGSRA